MSEDNRTHLDWQAISKASILLILSMIMSIGLVWSSYAYFQYMEDWAQKQNNQLISVRNKLTDVQNSMDIVQQDYLTDYATLVKKQFYTEDQDISFEEQLLALRDYTQHIVNKTKLDLQLFIADWHIRDKSIEYELDWMKNIADCKVLETYIHINLSSLHEGHIIKFLDRFYSFPPEGLFNLKSCEITQLASIQVDNVSKPYFQANCIFSWYIVKKIS